MLNDLPCTLLVIPTKLRIRLNLETALTTKLTWPDLAAVTGQFVNFSILKVSTLCMRDTPIAGVFG